MSTTSDSPWVTLASVLRARGKRGEVLAQSFTSGPERFDGQLAVSLWREGAERQNSRVEEAWEHQGLLVLKFAGVDSIDAAEQLRGWDVQVPIEARAPLAAGEYYQSDLIGAVLVDRTSGQELARVKGWKEFGAAPLLVVETADGREEMVPFTPVICVDVRPAEGRVLVDLPDGLLDLNRG